MHQLMIISSEESLEKINQVLQSETLWVEEVLSGANGQWLVVLTDNDPDSDWMTEEPEFEEDEFELEEEVSYEK